MDVFLRKYFWVVSLGVASLCGILIGRAGLRYFESVVLSSKDLRPMPHRASSNAPQKAYAKDTDEIVKRNVFCSTCQPQKEVVVDGGNTGPTSNDPVRSGLQLELVSTMVCPTDAAWSMAVIRDMSTKEKDPAMFAKGSKIFTSGAVIELVVNRKVYFRNNGRLEFIDMDGKDPPPAEKKNEPQPPPQGGPPPEASEYDKSIACQGTACTIDRALVDKLLSNTNALASAARFVPSVKDGKPNGFKVYAIRPNSLFAKIGLQNGDTIKGINGMEMTSPDKALEVYTKLRSASHLGVQLDRRGETTTLDYTIK